MELFRRIAELALVVLGALVSLYPTIVADFKNSFLIAFCMLGLVVTIITWHQDRKQENLLADIHLGQRLSADLIKQSTGQITGGETVPVVDVIRIPSGEVRLTIAAYGENDLHDVRFFVKIHTQEKSLLDKISGIKPADISCYIPLIAGGHLHILPNNIQPEGFLDEYQIEISAKNGYFRENLVVKTDANHRITSEYTISDRHGRILLSVPEISKTAVPPIMNPVGE